MPDENGLRVGREGNTKRGMQRKREKYAQRSKATHLSPLRRQLRPTSFSTYTHMFVTVVSMCACVVCVAVNSEIDIIFHKAEKWFQL